MERWRLRDIVGVKAWGLCPSFDHARERFNSIPAERWHILSDARHNEQYNGVLSGTGESIFVSSRRRLNAAQRSQAELTALYSDFYTNEYQAFLSASWTGFTTQGSQYGTDRPWHTADFNDYLQISISGTGPPLGGIWDSYLLYAPAMNWMPSCAAAQPEWGQNGFGNSAGFNTVENIAYYMPTYFVYRNTSQGEWFNWTLQNRFSLLCCFLF